MRIGGIDIEVPPEKLQATFQRIISEHKLEAQAERIAGIVVQQTETGGQLLLKPSQLSAELGIDEEEAGVVLAWLHYCSQMAKLRSQQADDGGTVQEDAAGIGADANDASGVYETAYWKQRYQSTGEASEQSWFASYADMQEYIASRLQPTHRILIVGCGDDALSKQLFDAGFTNITNIDPSKVVVDSMQAKYGEMTWHEMEGTQMTFENCSFDVVIEKTFDNLLESFRKGDFTTKLFDEKIKSLWCEIHDVLKPGGVYVSLNFAPKGVVLPWFHTWQSGIKGVIGYSPWTSVDEFTMTPSNVPEEDRGSGLEHTTFIATKGDGSALAAGESGR